MKRLPLLPPALILKVLLALVPLNWVTAADPYQTVSLELAHQFLLQESTTDEDLKTFKQKESVTGKKFNSAVDRAVKMGRTLIADGVASDSKHFPRLLAGGLGTAPSARRGQEATNDNRDSSNDSAQAKAKAEAAATKSLWLEGWKYYHHELTLPQREAFAQLNHIASAEWDTALAKSGPSAAPSAAGNDAGSAGIDQADRLLVSLGYTAKREKGDPSDTETAVAKMHQPEALITSATGTKTDGISRFFHAGFRRVDPYGFSEPTGTDQIRKLIDSDEESTAFIEFVYANRWAWNPERIVNATNGDESLFFKEPLKGKYYDFDARFSYNLSDSDDTSASAIAGGSDVSGEFNISRHILRHKFSDHAAYSINLEFGYGITSDAQQFDAHQRLFAGVGYNASFAAPGSSGRSGLFSIRAGWSGIDNVNFKDADSSELVTIRDGRIDYKMDDAIALETELIYPIGTDSALTFGARIYGKTDPNTWSVQIGYTKPLDDLLGGLFPSGSDEENKNKQTRTMGLNP